MPEFDPELEPGSWFDPELDPAAWFDGDIEPLASGIADCTITLGAGGIELSDFTVSTALVKLDLAQWTESPWLLLQLATFVTVGWDATNVDSITVSLEGLDGEVTTLGTAEGRYSMFPASRAQSKFAGSWEIDNGADTVVDVGLDTDANGISAAVMGSPETAMAFELARGQNYQFLVFEVTPTDPGEAVTLDWPEFEFPTEHPTAIWESGKCAGMLHENGPGWRWGQLDWRIEPLGFLDPPNVSGLTYGASSMVDALATRFRLLEPETGDLETAIGAVASAFVDSFEGPATVTVLDKFGMAVPLPAGNDRIIRFAMINSFAEVPPLTNFPTLKRDPNNWERTDEYWAGVYDMASGLRSLVGGGQGLKLQTPSNVDEGYWGTGVPPGWTRWRFAPALDNTETGWKIVSGTTELAEVRPWHGWFYVNLPAEGSGTWITEDVHSDRRRLLAYGSGSGVTLEIQDAGLAGIASSALGVTADWGAVRFAGPATPVSASLLTEEGGTVYRRVSEDSGRTWGAPTSLGSGAKPTMTVHADGIEYDYWIDGSAIKGRRFDRAGNALESTFTAVASGVDDAQISATSETMSTGQKRIVLRYLSVGTPTSKTSVDGITFT